MIFLKHTRHFLIAIILLGICTSDIAFAQKKKKKQEEDDFDFRYLEMTFVIKKDKKPLHGAQVTILKDNKRYQAFTASRNGRITVQLPVHFEYLISISKEGCITKKISISTTGVSDKEDKDVVWVYDDIEVELFEKIEGVAGAEILDKAYARVTFNDMYGDFDFDQEYAKSIKKELAKLSEAVKQKLIEEAEARAKQEAMGVLKAEAEAKSQAEKERLKAEAEAKAQADEAKAMREKETKSQMEKEEQVRKEQLQKESEDNVKIETELKVNVAATIKAFQELQEQRRASETSVAKTSATEKKIAEIKATAEFISVKQPEIKSGVKMQVNKEFSDKRKMLAKRDLKYAVTEPVFYSGNTTSTSTQAVMNNNTKADKKSTGNGNRDTHVSRMLAAIAEYENNTKR